MTPGRKANETPPAGHTSFTTSVDLPDYQEPGYLLTVDEKKMENAVWLIWEKREQSKSSNTLVFDELNKVISFGSTRHAFHKKKKQATLFSKLWENRKQIKSGKIAKQGQMLPPATLAVQIALVADNKNFAQDVKTQNSFKNLIKGIQRTIKNNKFPLHIDKKNGILLIETS